MNQLSRGQKSSLSLLFSLLVWKSFWLSYLLLPKKIGSSPFPPVWSYSSLVTVWNEALPQGLIRLFARFPRRPKDSGAIAIKHLVIQSTQNIPKVLIKYTKLLVKYKQVLKISFVPIVISALVVYSTEEYQAVLIFYSICLKVSVEQKYRILCHQPSTAA